MIVTLIGHELAREGGEFTYVGANNECRSCQLKTVCFNLKAGRDYRVTKLRDKRHDCPIHEGGVVVVEVEEQPLVGVVGREVMPGEVTKLQRLACRNIGCDHYSLCTTLAVQPEKSYVVTKACEKIDCPKGQTLYRADVSEQLQEARLA